MALVYDNFVMLAQLDLAILYILAQRFVLLVAILDIMDYLEQVDRHCENLPSCLQHLLVLLDNSLVLLLNLHLRLRLDRIGPQQLL